MITSSSSTSVSTAAAPLPSAKIACFNTKCSGSSTNLVSNNTDNSKLLSSAESSSQNQKTQQQQQQKLGIGWRLRSGEHAHLCSRCSGIYEQGTFCDVFHLESDGWRKCQTCAKRVHCGCIVSAPLYMLLDYGGIECISCARKTMSMTPNSMWSPSSLLSSQMLERTKEQPVKSWNQLSTSFPGQWRNGHHLWNTGAQSDLQQRLSLEFDRPLHNERLITSIRPSMSISDKKVTEPSGTINLHREEDSDLLYGRRNVPADSGSTRSALPSSSAKGDPSSLLTGLNAHFPSMNQSQNHMAPPLPKKSSRSSHNSNDASVEAHGGRSRVDPKTRAQLLPRYWPRITDQELQQISGDSNAIITPLFEKMLSASDAGRIGRLVLPKKCAEAYFPAIFQPEGVPLKVQDAGGNEWVFQFRFWPNNNSRMYVLEGVTPCIQSMQLQAGDTVTFSRIDPEGKLVMGFRKANNGSSDQDTQTVMTNNIPTPPNGSKGTGDSTVNATTTLSSQKGGIESRNLSTAADVTTLSKSDQAGVKLNDGSPIKSSQSRIRRRGNTLGSKNKRLRIESEDTMELNVTWQEAQDLLRPHPDHNPSIVVIEGHEIEEFEEAPVIGKPSIFTKDQSGDSNQWAQCENCFKWRKLPVDALLTLVWTCSKNKWDSERSSCSSAQEVSKELTYVLLHTGSTNPNTKIESNGAEPSDGLDTLANLAILEEGNLVSSQTTKHPRHRAGCTCIVCIQPPSGKGPKHKDTCDCNVCLTVKRRFKTLMLRRERKQSEKDSSSSSALLPPLPPQNATITNVDEVEEDDNDRSLPLDSPLKARIDLNIQPEREEEPSPKAEGGTTAAVAT